MTCELRQRSKSPQDIPGIFEEYPQYLVEMPPSAAAHFLHYFIQSSSVQCLSQTI